MGQESYPKDSCPTLFSHFFLCSLIFLSTLLMPLVLSSALLSRCPLPAVGYRLFMIPDPSPGIQRTEFGKRVSHNVAQQNWFRLLFLIPQ